MNEAVTQFLSTHLAVLPVLLPLFTAVGLLLLGDEGGQSGHTGVRLRSARAISLGSVVAGALMAWRLMTDASSGALTVYPLGNWPAPFGIVLVADYLALWMLITTNLLALCALLYALRGTDNSGAHFHVLFQLQICGLNGAFLTGDLFNLFVFTVI